MNKFCQISPDATIKDLFKKYGNIKAFNIRNNPGYRPSIYIEYNKSVKKIINIRKKHKLQ